MKCTTSDVDCRVINIERLNKDCNFEETEIQMLRKIIVEVAEILNLNDDWMNYGVKGFISDNENFSEELPMILRAKSPRPNEISSLPAS